MFVCGKVAHGKASPQTRSPYYVANAPLPHHENYARFSLGIERIDPVAFCDKCVLYFQDVQNRVFSSDKCCV